MSATQLINVALQLLEEALLLESDDMAQLHKDTADSSAVAAREEGILEGPVDGSRCDFIAIAIYPWHTFYTAQKTPCKPAVPWGLSGAARF